MGMSTMVGTINASTMTTTNLTFTPYQTASRSSGTLNCYNSKLFVTDSSSLSSHIIHQRFSLFYLNNKSSLQLVRSKNDGKFHLMLQFPDIDSKKGITWRQSGNPLELRGQCTHDIVANILLNQMLLVTFSCIL